MQGSLLSVWGNFAATCGCKSKSELLTLDQVYESPFHLHYALLDVFLEMQEIIKATFEGKGQIVWE